MGQLYPLPISNTSGVSVLAGSGLSGGGFVPIGGSVTLSASGGSQNSRKAYSVTPAPDGSFQTFTIVGFPSGLSLLYADVYVNGILQTLNTNYTFPSPGSILFSTAPASGDVIDVVFSNPNGNRFIYTLTPAADSVTTSFSFPADLPASSYVDIYVNGILQTPTTNYTLNRMSGVWTIIFTTAPTTGDALEAVFAPDEQTTRNLYATTPATDGVTTNFTIVGGTPSNPNIYIDTFLNGLYQTAGSNYFLNLVSGVWTIAMTTAPLTGDFLEVVF